MGDQWISSEPLTKSHRVVDGKRMAFHERGEGDAIVFLHGNPTSSYLWRNVVPFLAGYGRCIVADLIGFGDSDKLDDPGPSSYSLFEHQRYLYGLLEQLDLGDQVTFVTHDWGSVLGFAWARQQPQRVAGISYVEGMVRPIVWDDFLEIARPIFKAFRSPTGEELILENNAFVEGLIPAGVVRELSAAEMAEYRRPFQSPGEDRRPTLSFPRQFPLIPEPDELLHPAAAAVLRLVEECGRWMAESPIPKLFFSLDNSVNLGGAQREFCRTWRNQTEVAASGMHYLQEDDPALIGRALVAWLKTDVRADGAGGRWAELEKQGAGETA